MPRFSRKPGEFSLTSKWRVPKQHASVKEHILAHLCFSRTRSLLKVWDLYSAPLNKGVLLFQKSSGIALYQHVSFMTVEKSGLLTSG